LLQLPCRPPAQLLPSLRCAERPRRFYPECAAASSKPPCSSWIKSRRKCFLESMAHTRPKTDHTTRREIRSIRVRAHTKAWAMRHECVGPLYHVCSPVGQRHLSIQSLPEGRIPPPHRENRSAHRDTSRASHRSPPSQPDTSARGDNAALTSAQGSTTWNQRVFASDALTHLTRILYPSDTYIIPI
jgi:hypothetical protein